MFNRRKLTLILTIFFVFDEHFDTVEAGHCFAHRIADICYGIAETNVEENLCSTKFYSEKEPIELDGYVYAENCRDVNVETKLCDVECGLGQQCQWIDGVEMCVCSRESCRSSRLSSPVCASNNMTFDSLCLMEAWKCENYRSGLYKKYDGKCQKDCQNVKCPETDVCVLVKNNGEPICYPKKHCNPNAHPGPVCGVNGVTYPNVCALNLNRNKQGRTIDLAHRGACESKCREDLCQKDETCVYSKQLRPVCIRCQYPEGFLRLSGECSERVPVCADNGRLYPSYCSLLTDQCRKSRYFNIISYQKCPDRSRKFSPKNFIDRLG